MIKWFRNFIGILDIDYVKLDDLIIQETKKSEP